MCVCIYIHIYIHIYIYVEYITKCIDVWIYVRIDR